ncbi:MAG: hypothetical protein ABIK32_04480 [Chloroflexota bacterium]|nr:hypothetical protein [Chloroflexota bacterium]
MSKIKIKGYLVPFLIALITSILGVIGWFTLPLIERWFDQQDLKDDLTYYIDESVNLVGEKYYSDAIERLEIADEKANAIRSQNSRTEYLCVIRINKSICHFRIGAETKDKDKIKQSINMFKQILALPNIERFPAYINIVENYINTANWMLDNLS